GSALPSLQGVPIMANRTWLRGFGGFRALSLVGLLAYAPAARANEAIPDGVAPPPSILQHMLASNGFLFGSLMLFLALSLVGLILTLAWGLRRADMVGPERRDAHERALRWLGGLGV